MYIPIDKLSKIFGLENKNIKQRIIIVLALSAAVIVLYFVIVYLPMYARAQKLNASFIRMQEQIDKIQKISGKETDLKSVIDYYSGMQGKLTKNLPMSGEIIVKDLLNQANSLGIEVVSLTPQKPVKAVTPFDIEHGICEQIVILIDMNTSYKKLGQYLEALQYELAQSIKVDEVKIKNETENPERLHINIKLTSYLYY